eukprot:13063470-Alexandrium_andersonii.AAC.1
MDGVAGALSAAAGPSQRATPRGCAGHGRAGNAARCIGWGRPCAGRRAAMERRPTHQTASRTGRRQPRSPQRRHRQCSTFSRGPKRRCQRPRRPRWQSSSQRPKSRRARSSRRSS